MEAAALFSIICFRIKTNAKTLLQDLSLVGQTSDKTCVTLLLISVFFLSVFFCHFHMSWGEMKSIETG